MSATTKDTNPYQPNNRVKFNSNGHLLFGEKGTVVQVEEISTHVKLDSGIFIITSYKNLTKLKPKQK